MEKESRSGELPQVTDGTFLVLEYTAPVFETRTKEIVIKEEYAEHVVTPAEFETVQEASSYKLGEHWVATCCDNECTPQMEFNDDTVSLERTVTRVTQPATLTTVVHPAIVETIEYEYAVTPGNTRWVERTCATPKDNK